MRVATERVALLQQPTVDGLVDGIISADPPMLQCRDCGEVWTDGGRGGRLSMAVILSGCSGWGFRRCSCPTVRRCGECNKTHPRGHDRDALARGIEKRETGR